MRHKSVENYLYKTLLHTKRLNHLIAVFLGDTHLNYSQFGEFLKAMVDLFNTRLKNQIEKSV